jgi:type II secretory ATPase GspE/PulE/Tfp pilus assembly ATPase PilB-like protein
MTPQLREMVFKGESTEHVRRMARKQGMRTLFEDGIVKAMKGLTTLDEILRITQHDMISEVLIGGIKKDEKKSK